MTKYAPILLFVYNRPEHLKQTMETLQNNTLAAESELYIYSDAARKDTDEAAVTEVRTGDLRVISLTELPHKSAASGGLS